MIVRRLEDWVAERWDGPARIRAFFGKLLPRNVSWLHTLGSLLLLYISIQFVTGLLLSLYYSPSPDHAYQSLDYIKNELSFGWIVYSLHKCGASFVLVTAFLHLARSYFLSAYKAPREMVWCTGVVLSLVLVMFAFTGGLLPYDQRGYWAAMVGINIASSAPLVGDAVYDLMTGGYDNIGATTLSRFFITHVCILPLSLLGLIGLHLGLLQKVGSSGPLQGSPEPHHSFFPRQAVKDVLVAIAGAAVLFLVAVMLNFEDTGPAAPEAADFLPRPEWFFYAHFELLKLFPPELSVVGSFILPTVLFLLVFLLPFLDRGPSRAFGQRKFMTTMGVLGVLGLVIFTGIGIASAAAEAAAAEAEADTPAVEEDDPVARGRAQFLLERNDCITCHMVNDQGGDIGPDLSNAGRRLQPEFMREYVRQPEILNPDTEMPPWIGNEQELDDVVRYLQSLK